MVEQALAGVSTDTKAEPPETAGKTDPEETLTTTATPGEHVTDGLIGLAIFALEGARSLVTEEPKNPEKAISVLQDVDKFFRQIVTDVAIQNLLRRGLNYAYGDVLCRRALGVPRALLSRIRSGQGLTVSSFNTILADVVVAKEYLQVLAGDMPAAASELMRVVEQAGHESTRTALHLTPVIGYLAMLGEGASGKSVYGRPLSHTERALLGVGVIVGAVGPLVRAGRMAMTAAQIPGSRRSATWTSSDGSRRFVRYLLPAR